MTVSFPDDSNESTIFVSYKEFVQIYKNKIIEVVINSTPVTFTIAERLMENMVTIGFIAGNETIEKKLKVMLRVMK